MCRGKIVYYSHFYPCYTEKTLEKRASLFEGIGYFVFASVLYHIRQSDTETPHLHRMLSCVGL